MLLLAAAVAASCASGRALGKTQGTSHEEASGDVARRAFAAVSPLQEQMEMIRHLSVRSVMKQNAASAETADPQLAAALALAAGSPSVAHDLVVAHHYMRLGILDSAYVHANRALSKNPRSGEGHELMARIWREWGVPSLGMGPAARAIYFEPGSARAANTMGTLLTALGRPAEARVSFARAVALDPTASWALNNLCFVELQTGGLDEARAHCKAALEITPTLTVARNNLALTFVAAGDTAAARNTFLAAGDPAGAAYNSGIVDLARRQYDSAADAFEEAISARPGFTAAKTLAHDARMRAITAAHD
jgi:Tfp pilus assembly protein PilF